MNVDTRFSKYGEAEASFDLCSITDVEMFNRRHYEAAKVIQSDGRVLDLACGQGIGIEYFAAKCSSLVAVDVKSDNLRDILYQERFQSNLIVASAENLPFKNDSFDSILILEAIYYFRDMQSCLNESARILKNKIGTLFFCFPNKDIPAFNGSSYAERYYSVPEIFTMTSLFFSDVKIYGGFPVGTGTRGIGFRLIRKNIAVLLGRVPLGSNIKNFLKQKYMGYSHKFPTIVRDGEICGDDLVELPTDQKNGIYQVVYVVAKSKYM